MEHGMWTPDLGRCILLRLTRRYGVDAPIVLSSFNDGAVASIDCNALADGLRLKHHFAGCI